MDKRLLLKPLWFTSAFSNTPTYLYFNEQEDTFEVGCRAQARKHKFEFSDEEIKQMGKDFDLSFFKVLEEGKCGEEEAPEPLEPSFIDLDERIREKEGE